MRKLITIGVGVLLACLVGVTFLLHWIVRGCLWWECAPKRAFTVLDLELPSDLFPADAIINSLHPLSEGEGTLENGLKSVYWDQGAGIAIYGVLRYPSASRAIVVASEMRDLFVDQASNQPWERPSKVSITSPKADEFYVVCGNWTYNYRCGLVARYEEHVVRFNAVIDSKMTYEAFERIVIFIDEQMADHLD